MCGLLCALGLLAACYWSVLAWRLLSHLLWGSFLFLQTWNSSRLLPLLIRSRLNLPLPRPIDILRRITSPILIDLLILLITSRRQLHIISNLLRLYCISGVPLQLPIVFDHFITEQHLVNYLVIGSRVLEKRIVHVTSTCGVDS